MRADGLWEVAVGFVLDKFSENISKSTHMIIK